MEDFEVGVANTFKVSFKNMMYLLCRSTNFLIMLPKSGPLGDFIWESMVFLSVWGFALSCAGQRQNWGQAAD